MIPARHIHGVGWCSKTYVSVIPRASSLAHQDDNSPYSLSSTVPTLSDEKKEEIERAVKALLKGEDVEAHIDLGEL